MWDVRDLFTGNGITTTVSTIILRCDSIALVERLDILMVSKSAGNTGDNIETDANELLRRNKIGVPT